MKDVYAILDIGSTTIKLIVGEAVSSSNVNILFAKKAPSHGVKKGIIEDDRKLVKDIKDLVKSANESLETEIKSVGLNIPTHRTKLYQSDSMISLGEDGRRISYKDVEEALYKASEFKKGKEEEIVSVIPVKYHYDGGVSYDIPINIASRNLGVDALIITTNKKILYPYLSVVEKAGLEIMDISINAFSCAKEAFDSVYLQDGALLIDMGYKTSTISFYKDGYMKYLTVCPVGGYDFTKCISQDMQITMNQAETYKIKYGSLDAGLGKKDIIHTTYINDNRRDFRQQDLSDMLVKTAYEVMEQIKEKIAVIDDGNSYETLIVGGGGELELLDGVASEVLGAPVRMYRPDTIGIRDMAYVSSVGMIYYLIERSKILGKYEPSLVLPDVTNTMSMRFKGLTKPAKPNRVADNTNVGEKTGRFNKLMETFFNEDD